MPLPVAPSGTRSCTSPCCSWRCCLTTILDKLLRAGWLLTLVLGLIACSSSAPSFRNADITGADYGKSLSLADAAGRQRTLADFKGKAVLVFFGYTHCPDVCPTTLLEIKQALQQLGADAARVQVLFVTLDPDRDTAEVLGKYVPSFDP